MSPHKHPRPKTLEDYERKLRTQMERALRRKAAAMGYQLVQRSPASESVEPVPI